MKRLTIFVFLVLILSLTFPINLEKSKELFLYYINNFETSNDDEFLSNTRNSINTFLPIYRYYKIELVGSVEKTDVSKKIGDFLYVIYKQNISNDYTTQLARAAFFSYLEASLERKKFEASFIKSSPNFNNFFNSYQSKVIFAARNYLSDLLAKHLGAKINLAGNADIEDAPQYSFEFEYTPKFKEHEFIDEIKIILKDEEIKKNFVNYLEIISKNPERIVPNINRYSGLLQRNVIKSVSNLKNIFSDEFEKTAPKSYNFWWLRWVAYIVLILIAIKSKKWDLAIFIISIVEILYLFIGFDILSNSDATIYGLISFSALLASLIIFIKNKKFLEISLIALLLISFVIPTYYTKDFHMKNLKEFENSPYFTELINDVLKDKYSKFSNIVRELTTIANSSIIETEDIIKRLSINLNNFTEKIKDPEYKSVKNFDGRVNDFKALTTEFSNYQIEEKIREKQFKKAENNLEKFAKKVAKISSDAFENEFLKEIQNDLNFEEISPTVKKVNETIKNTRDLEKIPIQFYRTKFGILTFVFLSLGFFLTSLKSKNSIIWNIAATLSSILMLINPIIFFVQSGVPLITFNYIIVIPILLVISIIILIRSFKPIKG